MIPFSRAALLALPLALSWALGARQDPRGLVPAEPEDSLLVQSEEERAEKWTERLLDPDLDRREQHFERLIEAVRRNPGLRRQLELWAADRDRPELAWTARLALRDLARQPAWGFQVGPGTRGLGPTNPWFMDPFGPEGQAPEGLPDALPPGEGGPSSPESFSMKVGPDGVRVDVTREVDGERVTESFQDESLEALLEAHPELREKIRWGQGRAGFGWQQPRQVWPRQAVEEEPAPVRTDVLGVVLREVTPKERGPLGLDKGVGLRVDRVAEGTIASVLGVRAGWVLVEVNGHPIGTRDDVSRAMVERGRGGEVTVVIVDAQGRRRSRTWRPAD